MAAELHAQLMTRGRMSPIDLENLKITESQGVLQHLINVRARLLCLMDAATQQDDYKGAAQIAAVAQKNFEITARLLGDLHTGSLTVNNALIVMPEFLALRVSIMQALRGHPEARAAVALALQSVHKADLPNAETEEERAAAAPELAKARDVTRRRRAKQLIEGESRRVVRPRA